MSAAASGDELTRLLCPQAHVSGLTQSLVAGHHWRLGHSSVVCGHRFVQRYWKAVFTTFQRIFQRRWEQIFWTSFLVVIAAFYLSFAAYFGAPAHAWQTEVIGVAAFLVCAMGGLFARPAIALGYVRHGVWDLSHGLYGSSGTRAGGGSSGTGGSWR